MQRALFSGLQWFATEGVAMSTKYRRAGLCGQFLVRRRPVLFISRSTSKVIAGFAVAHVELVADYRVPHGMSAEKQRTVFDGGVESEIQRDVGGTPAVPTRAMTRFGLQCRAATWLAAERNRAAGRNPGRRKNPPCVSRRAPVPLSATASDDTR